MLRSWFVFVMAALLTLRATPQEAPVRFAGQPPPTPALTAVGAGLWRLAGQDPGSGITYVRVFLVATRSSARPAAAAASLDAPDLSSPTLTGQCTRDARGRLRFEMFVNFGGVTDTAFYPPWRSTGPEDLFPRPTDKLELRMEFLGYTKVKPLKRQFERVEAPGGDQMRYTNPGGGSSNLDPPGSFFLYLRSLPTLRLSGSAASAEFFTTPWLQQLHGEPLCAASGA